MNLKKKPQVFLNPIGYFVNDKVVTKIEIKPLNSVIFGYKRMENLKVIPQPFPTKSIKKSSIFTEDFFNRSFDKNRLKALISWSFFSFGEKKTIDLLESLKTMGYSYATKAGISLSIDDLKIPPSKKKHLRDAEQSLDFTNQEVQKGHLTSIEFFSKVIEVWNKTSELLKDEVIENFKTTDELNPVFLMAFSGARGNLSQVRQLVSMRGLMSDPQGQIINFPIQSNFREGLTLTEYVISCYGARKGVVDTALRTATSGYLTRRLVDVAHHVIVRSFDCQTKQGIYLTELKTGAKTILSLKKRLVGRRLAENIFTTKNEFIAGKNEEITNPLAILIAKNKTKVFVRSPLTCQEKGSLCQLCYGWSLANHRLVPLGEAVGIIAAQSIGEPGTQLTMRTFHTGGVFSGAVSDEIKAPLKGMAFFSESIPGKFIRTAYGQIAFLTKQEGFLDLIPFKNLEQAKKLASLPKENLDSFFDFLKEKIQIKLPAYSLLFVKQNQWVEKDQLLAEITSFLMDQNESVEASQTIYSEFSGEIRFQKSQILQPLKHMVILDSLTKVAKPKGTPPLTFTQKELKRKKNRRKNIFNPSISVSIGEFWILSAQKQNLLKPTKLFVYPGDFIHENALISFSRLTHLETSSAFLPNKIQKNKEFLLHNFVSSKNQINIETQQNLKLNSTKVLENVDFSHLALSKIFLKTSHFLSCHFFNEKQSFRKGNSFLFEESFPSQFTFKNNRQTGSFFNENTHFTQISSKSVLFSNKNKKEYSNNQIIKKGRFGQSAKHQVGFIPLFKTKTAGFGIQEQLNTTFESTLKTSPVFLLSSFCSTKRNKPCLDAQIFQLKNLNFYYFHPFDLPLKSRDKIFFTNTISKTYLLYISSLRFKKNLITFFSTYFLTPVDVLLDPTGNFAFSFLPPSLSLRKKIPLLNPSSVKKPFLEVVSFPPKNGYQNQNLPPFSFGLYNKEGENWKTKSFIFTEQFITEKNFSKPFYSFSGFLSQPLNLQLDGFDLLQQPRAKIPNLFNLVTKEKDFSLSANQKPFFETLCLPLFTSFTNSTVNRNLQKTLPISGLSSLFNIQIKRVDISTPLYSCLDLNLFQFERPFSNKKRKKINLVSKRNRFLWFHQDQKIVKAENGFFDFSGKNRNNKFVTSSRFYLSTFIAPLPKLGLLSSCLIKEKQWMTQKAKWDRKPFQKNRVKLSIQNSLEGWNILQPLPFGFSMAQTHISNSFSSEFSTPGSLTKKFSSFKKTQKKTKKSKTLTITKVPETKTHIFLLRQKSSSQMLKSKKSGICCNLKFQKSSNWNFNLLNNFPHSQPFSLAWFVFTFTAKVKKSPRRKKQIGHLASNFVKEETARMITKSEIFAAIFNYFIFEKYEKIDLEFDLIKQKSNLLHSIPVLNSLIKSARFFNLSLKAKTLFWNSSSFSVSGNKRVSFEKKLFTNQEITKSKTNKNFNKIESSFLIYKKRKLFANFDIPNFFNFRELYLSSLIFKNTSEGFLLTLPQKNKPFSLGSSFGLFGKKQRVNVPLFVKKRNKLKLCFYDFNYFSQSPKIIKKTKTVKNNEKAISSHGPIELYNSFSDKKLYYHYQKKESYDSNKIHKPSSFVSASLFGKKRKKKAFLRFPPNASFFILSFIVPPKSHSYKASTVFPFTNQLRTRLFKNIKQIFFIKSFSFSKNPKIWNSNAFITRNKTIFKDFNSFLFLQSEEINNSFLKKYFINKWTKSKKIPIKDLKLTARNLFQIKSNNSLPYLLKEDCNLIQRNLQKKSFHFFLILTLLKSFKTTSKIEIFNPLVKIPVFLSVQNHKIKRISKKLNFELVSQKLNRKSSHYLLTTQSGWVFSITNPNSFLHKHNLINLAGSSIINDISFDSFVTLTRFLPIRFQNRFFELKAELDFWLKTLKILPFGILNQSCFNSTDLTKIGKEDITSYFVEFTPTIRTEIDIFEKEFHGLKQRLFTFPFYSKALSFAVNTKGKIKKQGGKKSSQIFDFETSQNKKFRSKSFIIHPSFISKGQIEKILFSLEIPFDFRVNESKTFSLQKKALVAKEQLNKDNLFDKVFILKSYLTFPLRRLNLFVEKSPFKLSLNLKSKTSLIYPTTKIKGNNASFFVKESQFKKYPQSTIEIKRHNKQVINNYCRLNHFKTFQLPSFCKRFGKKKEVLDLVFSSSLKDLQNLILKTDIQKSFFSSSISLLLPFWPKLKNKELQLTRYPLLNNDVFVFNLNTRFKPKLIIVKSVILNDSILKNSSAFSPQTLNLQIQPPIFSLGEKTKGLKKTEKSVLLLDACEFHFVDHFEKNFRFEVDRKINIEFISHSNQTYLFTQKSNQYLSKTAKNYKNKISTVLNKTNLLKKRNLVSFAKLQPFVSRVNFHSSLSPINKLKTIPTKKNSCFVVLLNSIRYQLLFNKNSSNQKLLHFYKNKTVLLNQRKDLSRIQNKQQISKLLEVKPILFDGSKLNWAPKLHWTFFESLLSQQKQNFLKPFLLENSFSIFRKNSGYQSFLVKVGGLYKPMITKSRNIRKKKLLLEKSQPSSISHKRKDDNFQKWDFVDKMNLEYTEQGKKSLKFEKLKQRKTIYFSRASYFMTNSLSKTAINKRLKFSLLFQKNLVTQQDGIISGIPFENQKVFIAKEQKKKRSVRFVNISLHLENLESFSWLHKNKKRSFLGGRGTTPKKGGRGTTPKKESFLQGPKKGSPVKIAKAKRAQTQKAEIVKNSPFYEFSSKIFFQPQTFAISAAFHFHQIQITNHKTFLNKKGIGIDKNKSIVSKTFLTGMGGYGPLQNMKSWLTFQIINNKKLSKRKNKPFKKVYKIDLNSYFILKQNPKLLYLFSSAFLKNGSFSRPHILLAAPKSYLPLRQKDKRDINSKINKTLKNPQISSKKFTFFSHNRPVYLFQLHLDLSSVSDSLYNTKLLKKRLFEMSFKKTSQTLFQFLEKRTLKLTKISQFIQTKEALNLFDCDTSSFKGEIISAKNSLPFKIDDLMLVKKPSSELSFLTNSDLRSFSILKKQDFFSNFPNGVSELEAKLKIGQFVRYGKQISLGIGLNQPGQIISLQSNKMVLRYAKPFLLSSQGICAVRDREFVNFQTPLFTVKYKSLKTEDIVQGIPKIEQLFEARGNLQNKTSVPTLLKDKFYFYRKNYTRTEAVRKSIDFIQHYIVDGIQNVYQSQGVNISDKHIEIIVKQMISKVRIVEPNKCGLLKGEICDLDWIEETNSSISEKVEKADYEPLVLGITKAALGTRGFISAASFQETIKVLSKATIFQKHDFLRGLKENVILGNLLPAGTGDLNGFSKKNSSETFDFLFTTYNEQKGPLKEPSIFSEFFLSESFLTFNPQNLLMNVKNKVKTPKLNSTIKTKDQNFTNKKKKSESKKKTLEA